jgi:cell division protein FtsA
MYFLVLDIGSSQIKAFLAAIKKDKRLELLKIFKFASAGLNKGEVVAIDDLVPVLRVLFEEIQQFNKEALNNIFVNINGSNIRLHTSKGIIAVSRADNEIYQEDIDRVVKASEAINLGSNRVALHTLVKEFIIDGVAGILDPLGMTGTRLEVSSLIIDAFKPSVNNLVKCVELLNGKATIRPIYNPLAASRAVLNKVQKDLGVVCIDIGATTTGMSVYEENKLLLAKVFPVGSSHITNDLAIGLRSSIKTAERLKLSFGAAITKEVPPREKIDLKEIDNNAKGSISRRTIVGIIEARLEEIFDFVNDELKSIDKNGRLPAGVVLTGGGAKIPHIVELAKQILKLPTQIGIPDFENENIDILDSEIGLRLEDPEFSVASGLLLWGRDELMKNNNFWDRWYKKGWFSRFLKEFLP